MANAIQADRRSHTAVQQPPHKPTAASPGSTVVWPPPIVRGRHERWSVAWNRAYLAACATHDMAQKTQFLAQFNAHAAPKLTHELALQEWLNTKIMYLHLPVRSKLHLNVQTDYLGQPTQRYAAEYVLAKRFALHGCKAYLWVPYPGLLSYRNPHLQSQRNSSKICMITFQGTCMEQDPNEEAWEIGTGQRTDLDGNIGQEDFEQARPELLRWMHLLDVLGGDTVLAGHSLGGVMACRLAAELSPAQKKHTLLFTVGTPLLDEDTVARAEVGLKIVHHLVDHDGLTKVGGPRRCDGLVVKVQGVKRRISRQNHVATPLGDSLLDNRPLKFRFRRPKGDDRNLFLETARRIIRFARPWARP